MLPNDRFRYWPLIWIAVTSIATAAEENSPDGQLFDLSIQELMNVDVTAASKSVKHLVDTAAAVTVIGREDIRRSGATTIPDLLRFVPGLQVAQLNGNQWSVGVRGFSSVYSNKLLVMVDGRTVYNPIYTGVHWDQMGLMLEDIDRIEVVRGPGATQWGSNAMNGIINVITKSAVDTKGGLITAGGGNIETGFGGVRYGGKIGDDAYYRVYAKHSSRDNFPGLVAPIQLMQKPSLNGGQNHDRSHHDRGGFRLDWQADETNSLTFQGDFFQGDSDWSALLPNWSLGYDRINNTLGNSGENLLVNWKHQYSDDLKFETRAYWDHYRRLNSFYREEVSTLDIDAQANYRWNDSHQIVIGGGFRYSSDQLGDDVTGLLSFDPAKRKISTFNTFIQDDFTLIPDTLEFLYGVKYEHNGFAGSQAQPTGRLMWKVNEDNRIWAAVSHATRIPSRIDQDMSLRYLNLINLQDNLFCPGPAGTRCQYTVKGSPNYGAEKVDSFELGYRFNPNTDLSFDMTGFYNRYSDLNTRDDMGFHSLAGLPLQRFFVSHNYGRAESIGAEASTNWQVTSKWRLSANYSYLRLFMHKGARSTDNTAEPYVETTEAQNQVALRSLFNVTDKVELDGTLYYVDDRRYEDFRLPGLHAPSYFRLDTRIGWMVRPDLELDLIGQNLLDPRHLEFVDKLSPLPAEVPRSIFARMQWRF